MTGCRHVNLFVPDSPAGAICSSVIHEWAQGKYDSVTVVYCDKKTVEKEVHELTKLIRLAEKEKANPCTERMIIIVGFVLSSPCFNELKRVKGAEVRVHDSWTGIDVADKSMKRYFGFFKHKWHHGFRSLYEEMNAGFLFGFNWAPMYALHESLGADELEKCLTAYLHDLDKAASFNGYDMTDYYFEVFTERKQNDSNQTECI